MKTPILLASFLLIWSLQSSAASWQASPGLTGRLYFTDNLNLTPDDKESDAVVQVLPSISARRTGRRVQTRFAYAPSLLFYSSNSELNNVYHILQANVDSELIERIFFLDVSANANQSLINPRSRAAFDAVNNPDAFSQTASIRVTPDIRLPVFGGDYVDVRIRPGINYSFVADTADGDSNDGVGGQDSQINLTSGRLFTRMPWSINYRRRVFSSDTDDRFGRADGKVGYILSPRFRADVTAGYDEGRYNSVNDTSGFRWRLTGTWTPTQRTLFSLGVGEAFFGDDWRLRFRHQHKHSVWRAEYDVNVENSRQEIVDRQVVQFEDAFGNPLVDPLTGRREDVDVGSAPLVDDVYVRDRFRLGWAWFRGRNNVDLDLRYDRRDYQSADLDTQDGRVNLSFSRRLARRLSGRVRLEYWNHKEEGDPIDAFDFNQYRARIGLNYQLGSRTNASLDLLRTDRSSDNRLDEYTENRVDLSVSYAWKRGL